MATVEEVFNPDYRRGFSDLWAQLPLLRLGSSWVGGERCLICWGLK